MKQNFKRLASLVLALVICLGMLTVMGSAEGVTINSKMTAMQKAVVETTFQPNGFLTRAQTAKIIWCLGQL